MAAGTVHIPWYATLFRGDALAEALAEVAPAALRYGAKDYHVYRSRDDTYKFMHVISFESKADWERFWDSREMREFREAYSSWYQVPVLYVWNDVIASGRSELQEPVEQEV
jgi:quinol monooxygenase YgiN